jgi:hypothetical protein
MFNETLIELIEAWRQEAKDADKIGDPSLAAAFTQCADELEKEMARS